MERWMEQGACLEVDPEIFFPVRKPDEPKELSLTGRARAVCAECGVRQECAEYAFHTEPRSFRFGIWGGLTGKERSEVGRFAGRNDEIAGALLLYMWEKKKPVSPDP